MLSVLQRAACRPGTLCRPIYGAIRSLSAVSASAAAAAPAPFRVAVVGTGPGGFYTAKYLLKEDSSAHVDLLDALPTPFGLVRSGVAPDHPEVKSVTSDFEQVASDQRVNFLGNVRIGRDVSVAELLSLYDAVVLAYGAASDRALGIPGEDLNNTFSARAFVNWYNGHPDFRDFKPNLDAEDVVIIGQGNVAIDCARILVKTVAELEKTDIAGHALAALSRSRVRRVHVVGRRGHVQAAFTMKELREVTKLVDADFVLRPAELQAGRTAASAAEIAEHRAKKRMDELLSECASKPPAGLTRQLHMRFLLSPSEALPSQGGPIRDVGAVVFDVTRLEGDANKQRAVLTGQREIIKAGMVLKSVGYRSITVPGIPFCERRAVVHNDRGRVTHGDGGAPFPRAYVSGWLKRGPSGIIGTNIPDARETVARIIEDRAAGALASHGAATPPLDALKQLLLARGRHSDELISWADFTAINASEVARGAALGKPREKITSVEEALAIKKAAQSGAPNAV